MDQRDGGSDYIPFFFFSGAADFLPLRALVSLGMLARGGCKSEELVQGLNCDVRRVCN